MEFFIIGALITIGIWLIHIYNKLIHMIEAVHNNHKQIDVQLDRRFKVFQSLIEVVKKYMDYEQTVLNDVVALRSQAMSANKSGNQATKIEAENKISNLIPNIQVMFEQYPDLKASQNVLQLQEEIVSTENKLTFAKQSYNDSIERYNATKKSFLESMVVRVCASKLDHAFAYWQLTEDRKEQLEDYTVRL